ncbi:hypothetical protein [Ponticaulis profundi]|uniref:BON domain-containing protein n=1 Tax=Ponticaulis profundi TaxID=2665222 RepID=A0ABW1S5W1_9PROT
MTWHRRTILDLILIPVGLIAMAWLCWFAIYAGPHRADKIEAELSEKAHAALDHPDFAWANVEVTGQKAIISGEAPLRELEARAIRRVKQASGQGGFFWGGITRVENAIQLLPAQDDYVFRAEHQNNQLTLTGFLPSLAARDRIMQTLNALGRTERHIRDETRFAEGVPDGDWLGTAELGLTQILRIPDGEMILANKRLTLIGQAPTPEIRASILHKLTRPPSGYAADGMLQGRMVWSAVLEGDQLRFSGAVPDAADRTQIAELAERFFAGEIINDMGIKPMESRSWVLGVQSVLPNFVNFQSGYITYYGDDLLIEGEATESVLDYLREDTLRAEALVNFRIEAQPASVPLDAFATLRLDERPDRATCQAALQEAESNGPLIFEERDDMLGRESALVMDAILTVMRRCDDQVFEISAYQQSNGRAIATQKLTEARQQSFVDYFIARGVPLNQIDVEPVMADQAAPEWRLGDELNRQIRVRLRE